MITGIKSSAVMFARSSEISGLTGDKHEEVRSHRIHTLNENTRTVNCKNTCPYYNN